MVLVCGKGIGASAWAKGMGAHVCDYVYERLILHAAVSEKGGKDTQRGRCMYVRPSTLRGAMQHIPPHSIPNRNHNRNPNPNLKPDLSDILDHVEETGSPVEVVAWTPLPGLVVASIFPCPTPAHHHHHPAYTHTHTHARTQHWWIMS